MAEAQIKFGFLSYEAAFQSMPEYAKAQASLKDLKSKYDKELKRTEDEFNKKYEDFLDGQKDFPPSILQKRQMEMQEMLEKNIAFKEDTKKLLHDAENDTYAPIQEKLNNVIRSVGKEKGFAFILNTDYNSCPYIDTTQGEDINTIIKVRLK
jgi:outer membrane protein